MALLYSNENFPLPTVAALRRLGHDVLTVAEAGAASQRIPDEEVLAFASNRGRAVLTLNRRHFVRLHESDPIHSGIIVCTFDSAFAEQAQRIHEAIAPHASLAGLLLRVNRPG